MQSRFNPNRVLASALALLAVIAIVGVAATMQGDDSPSGLFYGWAKAVMGIVLLVIADRFIVPGIDFITEVRRGNIAAAIVYASLAVLIAVCVTAV